MVSIFAILRQPHPMLTRPCRQRGEFSMPVVVTSPVKISYPTATLFVETTRIELVTYAMP